MPMLTPVAVPDFRIAVAYAIFLASYVVFALGKFPGLKIDRTGAAIIGAVGMVAFRIVQPSDALRHIDFQTVVLLFSMMLIVGNLHLVGFFEWNAEAVLRRLKPQQLLPAVVFTCGFLSAFFVNDIVCLVMVPFVLSITRKMELQPLPYLLAVATASNIGSVATNGQSAEHADWVVLGDPLPGLSRAPGAGGAGGIVSRLGGAALDAHAERAGGAGRPGGDSPAGTGLVAADQAGDCGDGGGDRVFSGGGPGADGGAGRGGTADHAHARAAEAVQGSRLGAAGVFRGAVPDRGGRGECGPHRTAAQRGGTLEPATAVGVHHHGGRAVQPGQQRARGNAFEVAGARPRRSTQGLAGAGNGFDAGGKSHHHRQRGQHHCGGVGETGCGNRVQRLCTSGGTYHAADAGGRVGMAELGELTPISAARRGAVRLRACALGARGCRRPRRTIGRLHSDSQVSSSYERKAASSKLVYGSTPEHRQEGQ